MTPAAAPGTPQAEPKKKVTPPPSNYAKKRGADGQVKEEHEAVAKEELLPDVDLSMSYAEYLKVKRIRAQAEAAKAAGE